MARVTFLDLILEEALAAGLAHEMRSTQTKPPPKNFFILQNGDQAWEEFKEANKKENMVVCIEFVSEEQSKSNLFVDLARNHEDIPFLRVKVDESDTESFENVSDYLAY